MKLVNLRLILSRYPSNKEVRFYKENARPPHTELSLKDITEEAEGVNVKLMLKAVEGGHE